MWTWVKRPTNARHRRLPALWVGTISRLRSSIRRRCPSLTGSGTNWRGRTSLWGMPSTSPLRWISWSNKPPPMRIYVSVILGGAHSGEEGCLCYTKLLPNLIRGVLVCYFGCCLFWSVGELVLHYWCKWIFGLKGWYQFLMRRDICVFGRKGYFYVISYENLNTRHVLIVWRFLPSL